MMTSPYLLAAALALQGPSQSPQVGPQEEAPRASTSAELRNNIHEMRMSLLLGGEKVRDAEDEATSFYAGKVNLLNERIDTIAADLSEKHAAYDLALERTISSRALEQRKRAMTEASTLRSEITSLEIETQTLLKKRDEISELIGAIDERDRERGKLAAKIETSGTLQFEFGLPLAGIGLAPSLPPAEAPSPLANNALIEDLMAVDPRGAREVLFEMDPTGYWARFPLRPPAEGVVEAFGFPLPDLESNR